VASTISDPKAVAISYAGLNLNVKVHIMMPRSRTASKSPYLLACILFGANIILTDIQSQQRELKKISTAVNITHASVASYSNSKVMMIKNLGSIYMPSIDIVKEVSSMIQTLYYVGDKRDVNAINIQSPLAVEQGIPYPCNSASDAYVASALKLSDIAQANILNISAI
jgi:sensor domain CHASE-containing protein